jgi:HEAT repeat protein
VNLVVAKAAALTAELQLQVLVPDLLKAFERLFDDAVKADPQCWGKNALSKALKDLGYDESAGFLPGLQHVQMEPVWGKEVDTAGTLRATCALALLQCADLTREDKLWHLMRTLTDAEANVRADAARALQELDGREAALLLRLKARMGDRETSVTGQVLESLLGIERDGAVPFVTEFLALGDEEVREEAALSLGASRLPAAIAALMERWRRNRGSETSQALLRGISASRQQAAIDFLFDLIRNGSEGEALAALQALELHRESHEITRNIEEAVEKRGEGVVQSAFRRSFLAR